MPEKVVLAAPAIIPPTYLSFQIAQKVFAVFEEHGLHVKFLGGPLASRPAFIIALNDVDLDLAMYLGHGSPYALCMEDPLCQLGFGINDTHWLRNKILVAAPACEVGEYFAPRMIKDGGKAALASVEPMFAAFVENEHDYQADWHDYTILLYKTLMTESVGDAYQAYQDKCTEYLELYKSKLGTWPNADWYINSTTRNRDDFMLFGNPQAKIDYTPSPVERNIIMEVINKILYG